jgi:hypothetical protein
MQILTLGFLRLDNSVIRILCANCVANVEELVEGQVNGGVTVVYLTFFSTSVKVP